MKVLSAQQKAKELGISLSGLRQTRHLYKHIKKSPRKYLYFEEEYRPFIPETPVAVAKPRSRRRNVPFGQTLYSKAPGGSGEKLKVLNQMRAKMALEGSIPKEEQETFTEALAHKVKENYKKINEERKAQLRSELMADDERTRRKNISRYGGLYNPRQVSPRYSIQFARDAEEDCRNEEQNFLNSIEGPPKNYY
jgi:hypothetical protein